MKTMNFFDTKRVWNEVAAMRRGQRGMNVVAVLNCDKKLGKAHKDMMGRIVKVCMWNDRPLVSYSGNVNAKADTKFVAQPRKGFTWLQYPYFEVANKSGIEYLTFSYREGDKGSYNECYLIDGVLASEDLAKSYFKEEKKYTPQTQVSVGVTKEEDFSRCVRYETTKIVYIGDNKAKAIELYEECQK